MSVVYTIGHSTRPWPEFLDLLLTQKVKTLADVRSIPRSHHNPQYEQETLAAALKEAGVSYVWLKGLGGRRHTRKNSSNMGWRNASFRGYADYMQTAAFAEGLAELEGLARHAPTAIMCAEAVPWRCHRSLIADALTAAGWEVRDIIGPGEPKPHTLNPMARLEGGILTYPPPQEPLL
jgi:uncharacterized protein (DUF488 family)